MTAPVKHTTKDTPTGEEKSIILPGMLLGKYGKYEKIKRIGRGGQGDVYLVKDKSDQSQWVIKTCLLENLSDKQASLALGEAKKLAELKHPNIVQLREWTVFDNELLMVLEFCETGDLH